MELEVDIPRLRVTNASKKPHAIIFADCHAVHRAICPKNSL